MHQTRIALQLALSLAACTLVACGSSVEDVEPVSDGVAGGRSPEYGGEGAHEVTLYADFNVNQGYSLIDHAHYEWDIPVYGSPEWDAPLPDMDVRFNVNRFAVLQSVVEDGFCILTDTYASLSDLPTSGSCLPESRTFYMGLMGMPFEESTPGTGILVTTADGTELQLFITGGTMSGDHASIRFFYRTSPSTPAP